MTRVRAVHEAVLEAMHLGEVRADRLHAVALGGVMPRGNEGDPRFPRQVHVLLGDFACEVGVDAERDRVLEIALRAAGAPCDARDRAATPRRSPAAAARARGRPHPRDGSERPRRRDTAVADKVALAGAPLASTKPRRRASCALLPFGVRIQRQVVREEAEAVQQNANSARAAAR